MKHVSLCWLMTICIFLMAFGCASNKPVVQNQSKFVTAYPKGPTEYVIQQDDELDIKFFFNPELNETLKVRPDGKISLQLIDEIQAAGLTPSQLDKLLTRKYSRELRRPEVTVIVKSFAGQRVFVGGEVNRQGLIELTRGMTALQAVINAGGFNEAAKPEAALIIRKGPDGRPAPFGVDLSKAINEEGPGGDMELLPYDIVYVPKTWIAKANKWVLQYVQNLLLFRGWSFGFNYELRDNLNINF